MLRRLSVCLLALGCLGFEWPGLAQRLLHELEHEKPEVRRELVQKLGQYPASVTKGVLLVALEDPDASVRLGAASAAGRGRVREAVPILLDWLDDTEASTRQVAAVALGEIGEARALASLTRALSDTTTEVRSAATVALGRLGIADAVVALLGRLEDTDLDVRIDAIASLALLRDARAVMPLLGAAIDPSADVRAAAARCLGAIGDSRALPALTRMLSDSVEDVRIASVAAISMLRDPAALRALSATLEHADTRTALAIVAALGAIDDDASRTLLIAKLGVRALQPSATRALLRHARRLRRAATLDPAADGAAIPVIDSFVTDLADALTSTTGEQQAAIAETLLGVAEITSIAGATPALLAALRSPPPEAIPSLLNALGATGSPDALLPLLELVGQAGDAAMQPPLDALRLYFERAEPDGRAADPLLARLATQDLAQRIQLVELLGQSGAARALPALVLLFTHSDRALRLAAIQAAGTLAAAEAGPRLLALLDSDDPKTRFTSAIALRATADVGVAQALVDRLNPSRPLDRHAALIALGGALLRLSRQGPLPDALQSGALAELDALIAGDDDGLADRAVDALSIWAPSVALDHVAQALRTPSSRRRAVVTAAIGQLEGKDARMLLRYQLGHGTAREVAAAALALGEAGDARELSVLTQAAKRKRWPVPAAAAFALSRLAERGVLRPHAAGRALCELGASRSPYVRANVASAMAALAAAPCPDNGPDPLSWLEAPHASVVRSAAAHWTHAALAAGRLDAAKAHEALFTCAQSAADPEVRAACEGPSPTITTRQAVDVYARASNGIDLLSNRLVAVRFSNGSVQLSRTDENGHLRLKSAPEGKLHLEDPGLLPLEPERAEQD